MYIAMNRFAIKPGHEETFLEIWRNRDSRLEGVPGFEQFNMLQGPTTDEHTLFVSHTYWESREAFEAWTQSEAFRQAHAGAGGRKDIYLGPPRFEGFEVKL